MHQHHFIARLPLSSFSPLFAWETRLDSLYPGGCAPFFDHKGWRDRASRHGIKLVRNA
jgi:hypothetical protein